MSWKPYKIGVITSLVSTIIFIIFLQPILSFTWNVVVGVAGHVHQGYVDHIYKSAALGSNLMGAMTFFAAFAVFALLPYLFVSVAGGPVMNDRLGIKVLPPLMLVMAILLLVGFSLCGGIEIIRTSFTQRITILAPKIDDNEYKILRARWASMQTKADYDALVAAMDMRAKELNVALPPVRKP